MTLNDSVSEKAGIHLSKLHCNLPYETPQPLYKAVNVSVKDSRSLPSVSSSNKQDYLSPFSLFLVKMERTQIETPKPSETLFSFTRRRSPLKSETYYTLVRILSHCYDKSHSSQAAQFVSQELNPGSSIRNTSPFYFTVICKTRRVSCSIFRNAFWLLRN